jgi:CheY-like chemotaxis protein
MDRKQILLVEDNQEYTKTAREYLESRDLAVAHAKDYSEAVAQLRNPNQFNGVITDLFFPNRTGSNSISLGINLVNRLIEQLIQNPRK